MVVLIATVAIGLYLLLSVLLGGWPGSRFNRERFLLGCLAGIFLAQFILYGVGVGLCAHLLDQRYSQLRSRGCPEILNRLNDAFESAINATLALLGGSGPAAAGGPGGKRAWIRVRQGTSTRTRTRTRWAVMPMTHNPVRGGYAPGRSSVRRGKG